MFFCKFFPFISVLFIVCATFVLSDDEREGLVDRIVATGGHVLQNAFQARKTPCTCGIFLEGQYSEDQNGLESDPAFEKELLIPMLPCGYRGNKICQDRCLDEIVPHIPQIGPLMCSAIDRNCFRERASLFIKNCDNVWRSSGLTLGREFCCFSGLQVKCPRNWFGQGKSQLLSTVSSSIKSELFESPPSETRRTIPEVILDLADKAVDIVTDVLNKTV